MLISFLENEHATEQEHMEMLHPDEQQDDGEFQEADILWPDDAAQGLQLPQQVFYYSQADDPDDDDGDHEEYFSSDHRRPMKLQIGQRTSSPIDIPGRGRKGAAKGAKAQPGLISSKLGASRASASYGGSGSGSVMVAGSHVFVPPHVIVDGRAKREKAMMMFVVPSERPARKMRGLNY